MVEQQNVPRALYCAVGNYIALDSISEEQKEKIISSAMERLAIQTLEDIRQILEDTRFDDPTCFQRIDGLVTTFYQKLNIASKRRQALE